MAASTKSRFPAKTLFINRELSWLAFNQRVLDEARNLQVPLMERLKFLAITSNNLDEFFMVRVGGLQMLKAQGRAPRDPVGLTPNQQLRQISRRAKAMVAEQYACYTEDLQLALHRARIQQCSMDRLDQQQARHLEELFETLIYPVVTPMAIDPDQPFPLLPALTLHVAVVLPPPAEQPDGASRLAVVSLPRSIARLLTLPHMDGHAYALLEDVLMAYMERFFPGEAIEEMAPFRLTRNADMRVRENDAPDLMTGMEDILDERRSSACVRLEVAASASPDLIRQLQDAVEVASDFVFRIPGPLDLNAFMGLATMSGFEEYKEEEWPAVTRPNLRPPDSMFEILSRDDVLLAHPFDSFDPVVRLIDEAADDPGVLAIKQILYRTSARSPIVAALARAAENGKQVTVIVELKARFDEARNIEWALALERAGVQVIYGVRGLKTHAKVCIVIRREAGGIRRYIHFGTGNYNEKTARLYTDISYMTCNADFGADAAAFFNTISGYGQPIQFRKIAMAPTGLRATLLDGIEAEIARCEQGQKGHIMAKFNSLVDPMLIDALYRASQAGVKVELNVRGICCLRPGVPGLSENIRVVSIVDRFLEHSRIVYFRHGNDPRYYISSADWMPRNLDKRVELLVPVEHPGAQKRLHEILRTCLKDNVKGRELDMDGAYALRQPGSRRRALRSQEVFYRQAQQVVADLEAAQRKVFTPHRPLSEEPGGEAE
jgi:polyphosphate kinase